VRPAFDPSPFFFRRSMFPNPSSPRRLLRFSFFPQRSFFCEPRRRFSSWCLFFWIFTFASDFRTPSLRDRRKQAFLPTSAISDFPNTAYTRCVIDTRDKRFGRSTAISPHCDPIPLFCQIPCGALPFFFLQLKAAWPIFPPACCPSLHP